MKVFISVLLLALTTPALADAPKSKKEAKDRPYKLCVCNNGASRDCGKVTVNEGQCLKVTARSYTRVASDPTKRDCVFDDRVICINPMFSDSGIEIIR